MNVNRIIVTKKKKIEKTLLFFGDNEVGKTTLLHQFIKGEIPQNYQTTIGVNFYTKDIDDLTLCIYDSNGEEIKTQILSQNFFRNSDCFIVVMSYHKKQSIDLGIQYINFIISNSAYKDQPILVLINKEDIKKKEFTLSFAVEKIKEKYPNIIIGESSALDAIKVAKMFNNIVSVLMGNAQISTRNDLFLASTFKLNEHLAVKEKCCS